MVRLRWVLTVVSEQYRRALISALLSPVGTLEECGGMASSVATTLMSETLDWWQE